MSGNRQNIKQNNLINFEQLFILEPQFARKALNVNHNDLPVYTEQEVSNNCPTLIEDSFFIIPAINMDEIVDMNPQHAAIQFRSYEYDGMLTNDEKQIAFNKSDTVHLKLGNLYLIYNKCKNSLPLEIIVNFINWDNKQIIPILSTINSLSKDKFVTSNSLPIILNNKDDTDTTKTSLIRTAAKKLEQQLKDMVQSGKINFAEISHAYNDLITELLLNQNHHIKLSDQECDAIVNIVSSKSIPTVDKLVDTLVANMSQLTALLSDENFNYIRNKLENKIIQLEVGHDVVMNSIEKTLQRRRKMPSNYTSYDRYIDLSLEALEAANTAYENAKNENQKSKNKMSEINNLFYTQAHEKNEKALSKIEHPLFETISDVKNFIMKIKACELSVIQDLRLEQINKQLSKVRLFKINMSFTRSLAKLRNKSFHSVLPKTLSTNTVADKNYLQTIPVYSDIEVMRFTAERFKRENFYLLTGKEIPQSQAERRKLFSDRKLAHLKVGNLYIAFGTFGKGSFKLSVHMIDWEKNIMATLVDTSNMRYTKSPYENILPFPIETNNRSFTNVDGMTGKVTEEDINAVMPLKQLIAQLAQGADISIMEGNNIVVKVDTELNWRQYDQKIIKALQSALLAYCNLNITMENKHIENIFIDLWSDLPGYFNADKFNEILNQVLKSAERKYLETGSSVKYFTEYEVIKKSFDNLNKPQIIEKLAVRLPRQAVSPFSQSGTADLELPLLDLFRCVVAKWKRTIPASPQENVKFNPQNVNVTPTSSSGLFAVYSNVADEAALYNISSSSMKLGK